jgi:hypothetical protein
MRIPVKEVVRLKRRASYEGYVYYFLILLLKGTVRKPFKQCHFQSIFFDQTSAAELEPEPKEPQLYTVAEMEPEPEPEPEP